MGRILAVDARQPDNAPTPAADDEAAGIVADREGEPAEEIVAVDALGLELDLVVLLRHVLRPGDPAHVGAAADEDRAILNGNLPFATERRALPAAKRLAVEQRLPAGVPGVGGPGPRGLLGGGQLGDDCVGFVHRPQGGEDPSGVDGDSPALPIVVGDVEDQ